MNKKPNMKIGAVVVFKTDDWEDQGTDELTAVQMWLDDLARAGLIEPTTAKEYDADLGGPVFYLP